jgi:hypothetical protein
VGKIAWHCNHDCAELRNFAHAFAPRDTDAAAIGSKVSARVFASQAINSLPHEGMFMRRRA